MDRAVATEVPMRGGITDGARVTHAASAGGVLRDPAAERITTAVIPIDLVAGNHRATAAMVTDDATVTPVIGFTDSRGGEAKGKNDGDESEDFFHSGDELDVRRSQTSLFETYSATPEIFFSTPA